MCHDYFQSSAFARNIFHTSGVQTLAEESKCYWLIDAIVSYQLSVKIRQEPFQVWTLKVENNQGVLTCGDGNDTPPLISQKIPYTDFPLEEITLYLEDGSLDGEHFAKVLMLPSER